MKKWLVICLAALCLVTAAVFMNFASSERTAENQGYPGGPELDILYGGTDELSGYITEKLIEDFAQKYSISVNTSWPSDGGGYDEWMKKKIALGELGDIIEVRDIGPYIELDLLGVLPESAVQNMDYVYVYGDQIYSLPLNIKMTGVIYNKAIFREYNLEEPETYDDFLTICETLKQNDITPLAVGGKNIWHMGFWINHFFRADVLSANDRWLQERYEGKTSWKDPEIITMIGHICDLFQRGYVMEGWENTLDNQMASIIGTGEACMLYSGTWMFEQILNIDPDFELGWFVLPDEDGERYSYSSHLIGDGWAITKECYENKEKYEAALLFLDFFYSEEVYSEYCDVTNSLPVLTEFEVYEPTPIQEKVIRDYEEHVKMVSMQIENNFTPENFRLSMFAAVRETILGGFPISDLPEEIEKLWDAP